MTVIVATKSGLYADSFCARNTLRTPGFTTPKLFKLGGVSIGCAGDNNAVASFLDAIKAGKPFYELTSPDADFEALVVAQSKIWLYVGVCPAQPVLGEFFAVGTGASYALGALEAGASPEEAIHAACKYDPFCKAPVQSLLHKSSRIHCAQA